ncbi:DUF2330 domain-containing protein [Sandaracinus amylolyticus]|uniref:DUF2330 domain-containing protein n=1 Tax=Sandaracinus amylolyticus TaxID=927083 RepID=UPI001F3A5AAA|nr:DUF2330 domain-containing protein [Sandaracinus amylolyticus]UJR78822.1 Hypothetical protein I5071_8550 [Sandaracinus amylolyticus]
MLRRLFVATAVCAALTPLFVPDVARACGGCFHPPEGNPSPVTGHRMAIALGTTQTTLWDQIAYEGDPADFVWVLPIAGTSTVEIAENAFFESLVAHTTITLVAPPPPRVSCDDPCGDSFFASSDAAPGRELGGDGSVTVHHEGVVGPYATATIGSEDPDALVTWLRDNRYQVPDAMLPTITHYVDLGMNFVVLRLSPSANVQRMVPVRVTVPGLSTTFPLRMVAAGVEVSVELELFVFAESRIEAANFGNAEVDRAAVSFDWATLTFDYDARYEDALFAGEGVGTNWVTEYATIAPTSIGTYQSFPPDGSATTSAAADWAVVTRSVSEPYLTRMRTRLPVSELGVDLQLRMSDREDLAETRVMVTRERNRADEPECPTFCAHPGIGPGTSGRGRGDGLRCSTSMPGAGARGLIALAIVGAAAIALRRRRA